MKRAVAIYTQCDLDVNYTREPISHSPTIKCNYMTQLHIYVIQFLFNSSHKTSENWNKLQMIWEQNKINVKHYSGIDSVEEWEKSGQFSSFFKMLQVEFLLPNFLKITTTLFFKHMWRKKKYISRWSAQCSQLRAYVWTQKQAQKKKKNEKKKKKIQKNQQHHSSI